MTDIAYVLVSAAIILLACVIKTPEAMLFSWVSALILIEFYRGGASRD